LQANFLISFFILTNALEDPAVIGGKPIEVINTILRFGYVGLLLTCFMLSLGNRPQGSKWGYTLAFVGFALLTVYMTVRYVPLCLLPFLSYFRSSPRCPTARCPPESCQRFLGISCFADCRAQFAAVFLSVKSVIQIKADAGPLTAADFFTNAIFRDVVLSLVATIGLYIFASVIHVRHIFALEIGDEANGCTARPVAYDHVLYTVHAYRTVVH
jgi:chitin synthase